MSIIKRISSLFPVMQEEVKSFRLLFLQSLFIGFANSYYYIVSSSFLLKNISIKNLPNAYIIAGTAGFLLIQLYKNMQKKYGIAGSYQISLMIFALVCFLNFIAMLELSSNKAFSVFLAYFTVLFAAPFTAIFSLALFAQCSRLYNMAQSKRLLALVISGEIFSSILAYLSIPLMGPVIKGHVFILLPVAGLFTLLVFIPFSKILELNKVKFQLPIARKDAVKVDLAFFKKDKFYLLIGVTTLFSVFAIYVVDYAYLISVRYMSSISGLEIAQIVSVFFFMVKIGELSFSFLSGKILSSKGVKFSLLLLPLILLLFSALAFISGFLFNGVPIFLLSFLFLAKIAERAIRKSITTPSVKVMYQVAEPHDRLEIEASIDGLLNQLATIFSGVLLLAISFAFFGNNMFSLLHLFSFVCIVAFALWSLFSLRMYDNYRIKIRDFLYKIKSAHHHVAKHSPRRAEDNAVVVADGAQLADRINAAVKAVSNAHKHDLTNLVKIYNPKYSLDSKFESEDVIAKKLVHIYYNNEFYFSRLLIIKFIAYYNEHESLTFLKELWEVSDITCRLELMMAFNEREYKNVDPVFFERQCEECVKEMIWVEAAIHDVTELNNMFLENELNEHKLILTHLLFELLKPIYEPAVIQVIYEIIIKYKDDVEHQLFALELLDITLQPGLKEMIKPILEPIAFENKKQKLDKTFHIYHFSPEERLVDILMKDYNLVSLRLKETALIAYNKIAGDKHLLSAFRTNSIENLKYKADELFTGGKDALYEAKMEILERVEDKFDELLPFGPYVLNYAIFVPKQLKVIVNANAVKIGSNQQYIIELRSAENIKVKLDSLAIALLITLKQRQVNAPLATELVG